MGFELGNFTSSVWRLWLYQRIKPGGLRPQADARHSRESGNPVSAFCLFELIKNWIPDQCTSCAVRDDFILKSLDLDGRTGGFEFLLELRGVVLVHAFLHGGGSGLDEILGFLQTQAGDRADSLDHFNL